MKGLNLSKLKKISSDDKCTVFQHPDGHSIKIAHKALQPKMRDELSRIPLAKGGMIKKYADGSEDGPVSSDDSSSSAPPINININGQPQNSSQMPQPWTPDQYKPDPKIEAEHARLRDYYASKPGGALAGSPDDRASSDIQNMNAYNENPASFSNSGAASVKTNEAIANPSKPWEASAGAATNTPDQATSPQGGLAQGQAPAPQQDATAQAPDRSPAQQQTEEEYQAESPAMPAQAQPQTYQDVKNTQLQHYTTQDQAFQNDLNNGHITPETYKDLFDKKSTLGKIGMIFGMMAGGAGAAGSHQPNVLLEMMNNQIKNDLDAQIKSKDNAKSWIGLNQAHLANQANIGLTQAQTTSSLVGAQSQAYALANMQMNRAALHQMALQVSALPAGSPQRAQAESTLAMMSQGVQNENFNIADRASAASAFANMLNQSGEGGTEGAFQNKTNKLRLMGPQGEMAAKNLESKHMPGFSGQASDALDNGTKEELKKYVNFDQQLGRFMEWTKSHSGSLNPAEINQGKVLASSLQSKYREAALNTVYRPGEQPLLNQVIPSDPTKFLNKWRVMPQLEALKKENENQLNTAASNEGLGKYVGSSGQSKPSEQPQSNEIERLDPKSGRTVIYDAQTKKPLRWK